MLNKMIFLDAGHGGIDANGKYVTAPGKQFNHTIESPMAFHRFGWFYEGVWNRAFTDRVAYKLKQIGIPYIYLHHPYLDTPLEERVEKANWYHWNFQNGILISNHANASGNHKARGFEVYTSRGETHSDTIAEYDWRNVRGLMESRIRYRKDTSDGDHDKESRFFMLTKTVMPAILVEHLFFDNYDDARLLMDEDIMDRFTEAQVRTIIEYLNIT